MFPTGRSAAASFEEHGLFYWFSHEDSSHKLHVGESANGRLGPSPSAQGEGRVRLAQGSSHRNHINDWTRRFSYVPSQRAGADWNFETPATVPGTMTPSLVQKPDATKRELYGYPSRIKTVAEAEPAQKLRTRAIEADHDRVLGASTSRIPTSGLIPMAERTINSISITSQTTSIRIRLRFCRNTKAPFRMVHHADTH